jgi:hypothetical protein
MHTTTITPGTRVTIREADGSEWEAEALSGVEERGHAFPIVWVNRPLTAGGFDPAPWPADAVEVVS